MASAFARSALRLSYCLLLNCHSTIGVPASVAATVFASEPPPEYLEEGLPVVTETVPIYTENEPAVIHVQKEHEPGTPKISKVEIICREASVEALKNALVNIGITGMTITHVLGCGVQKGRPEYYRGIATEVSLLPKVQFDIVVSKVPVRTVIETAKKVLYTGHIGDGKIFVYDVENVIKVRTSEEGYDALQDVE